MHRISAALACMAVVVTAGCGSAKATTQGHPAPAHPTPHCQSAPSILSNADSGKTFCLRVGHQVGIILHSTQRDRWLVPLASGSVLKAVPSGMLSLVAGATGVFYQAARPGRAVVTSVRPPCGATANPAGTSYPVRSCAPKDRFTVTIVAS